MVGETSDFTAHVKVTAPNTLVVTALIVTPLSGNKYKHVDNCVR
jgi:hypothetical protein